MVDGLDLELGGDDAFDDDVDECSDGRRHTHAVDRLDVPIVEPRVVQPENVGNGGHSPKPWRHRHVQFRRHDVGEVVQCQRSRVTEDPLWFVLPIP